MNSTISLSIGYAIGLLVAIAWSRIEVWAKRDPLTVESNVLLVCLGWIMVPITLVCFAINDVYHGLAKLYKWL